MSPISFFQALSKVGSSLKSNKKQNSKKRTKGPRDDSVSPPPHMREHSTLTREEKRQRKEAAMLGLSSSSSSYPSSSSKRKNVSGMHTPREMLQKSERIATDAALVPLGTQKRDNRSVDQIERDLIAARQAKLKLQGSNGKRGDLIDEEKRIDQELESILRRKRAMEMKRLADRGLPVSDDLYSDERRGNRGLEEEGARRRRSLSPMGAPKKTRPQSGGMINQYGLSPADYLPGAPIKALPKAMVKRDDGPKKKVATKADSREREKEKEKERAGPPKKETPREKFLREEAERKKKQQLSKKELDSDGLTNSEEEEDDDDDEEDVSEEDYESDEEEEGDDPRASRSAVSQEIWKMFNRKDKSEYLARDFDSDDEVMEADMESVRREEMRSAHLARLEDQREEEALRKREREKARRKAERGRA